MELLQMLPELNREQLLQVAHREAVPITCSLSECLLRADIEKAILARHELNPILFGPDPLGRNYAVEVGMNLDLFKSNSPTIPMCREWLLEQGAPEEYLDDSALMSAVGALIYERHLPLPKFLWYGQNYLKIFSMSPEQISAMFGTPLHLTPEEYIWIRPYQVSERTPFSPILILLYQSLPNLLMFAQSLRVKGVYFQTLRGVLDYLSNYRLSLEQILDYFIPLHDYPARKDVVQAYFQTGVQLKRPFTVSNGQDSRIPLAVPPTWYEKTFLLIYLRSSDRIFHLTQAFPSLSRMNLNIYAIIDTLDRQTFLDPSLRVSRTELAEIVRTLSGRYLKLSEDALFEVTKWRGIVIVNRILSEIQSNLDTVLFQLISDGRICSNRRDVLLQDFDENFAITYGTFLDFRCYPPPVCLAEAKQTCSTPLGGVQRNSLIPFSLMFQIPLLHSENPKLLRLSSVWMKSSNFREFSITRILTIFQDIEKELNH
jgi:hypothetical protein